MSEYWWSRREHELIFVKLGAGVGAGIISGGELHHGQAGTAGEIGHLSIDINGPKCECGQRGCLVKYIGKSALADMGRQLSLGTDDGILSRISIEASRGQEQAQAFRTQIIERFATGLISVINMFAPNAVYVSGSTDALDATFFDQLESVIASRQGSPAKDSSVFVRRSSDATRWPSEQGPWCSSARSPMFESLSMRITNHTRCKYELRTFVTALGAHKHSKACARRRFVAVFLLLSLALHSSGCRQAHRTHSEAYSSRRLR